MARFTTGTVRCTEIHGCAFSGERWKRSAVSAVLVRKTHGNDYLSERQARTELTRIDREVRRLKVQIARLEQRKSKLIAASRK
jgi:hypothetical protein